MILLISFISLFWLVPCAVVALVLVLTKTTKYLGVVSTNTSGINPWGRWLIVYPVEFFILLFAFLWVGGTPAKTFLYGRIKEVWVLAKRKGGGL